ncbi:MAG TPA: hypothetical protein VHX44_06675 [Planctomycetota bacterium]|jgi:hypothetical protein|nr:hypothetical protein [Planctomycetota bacterium]
MKHSNTVIINNPALQAMRAMAIGLLDRMEWRHHGIGVLQGYVSEKGEPEVRLHVWSRRLLKPGMDLSGDVHDHRFDLVSHVLCGAVEHEEMIPVKHRGGDHAMLTLTHARAAVETKYHGPTKPLPGRFSVHRERMTIHAGQSYQFPAQMFHRSPLVGGLDAVAVTVVEKHRQQDVPARLLYPVGKKPVMAFGHDMDQALVRRVVGLARARLVRALS